MARLVGEVTLIVLHGDPQLVEAVVQVAKLERSRSGGLCVSISRMQVALDQHRGRGLHTAGEDG
jgi:hypothetical protein